MGISHEVLYQLAAKFGGLLPHLDVRQRRLLMGAEARVWDTAGFGPWLRRPGVSETTVRKGVDEVDAGALPVGRVRRPGGGRKKAAVVDPGLRPALLALVEPDMRGDPMSPLRWTTKSTRRLAAELTRQGHTVSADTVGYLLREEGFSLQANSKTLEGTQHPDRDAQFRYINEQAKDHVDAGDPVISVDTKKRELVGAYKNTGREWRRVGEPRGLTAHAELDPGTYDTGIKVSDREIDALAVHGHRVHGDWNYTLHSQPREATSGSWTPLSVGRLLPPGTGCLRNPELTGMHEPDLTAIVDQLALELGELREQGRLQQRGGERLQGRGAGARTSSPPPTGSWPQCSTCG